MMNSINQVSKLINNTLGENYISLNKLTFLLKNKKVSYKVIYHNRQVVAIAWMQLLPKEKLRIKTKHKVHITKPMKVLEVVMVHPNFQKRGIGSKVVKDLLVDINSSVICLAWKSNSVIFLNNILLNQGFKKIKTNYLHYYNNSIVDNYCCKICGNPPCKCAVTVFKKSIRKI